MSVEVIKQGELGAHPIISNLVKMPKDNRSILRKLADLPKDERMAIIDDIIAKRYPEHGYEGIKYDWELNARPSQLIPFDFTNDWSTYVINSGRGWGKGAELDTPIPTPKGWTTMGQIEAGDKVFDEQGSVCNVTAVTDVYMPNKAYKIYFSDNTSVVVCDEHQWITWTNRDRKKYQRQDAKRKNNNPIGMFPIDWINWSANGERSDSGRFGPTIKTTKDIIDTFYQVANQKANHCIPLCRPLNLSEKQLPIHPYLLGLFYGDGIAASGQISCDKKDYESYKIYLESNGFVVGNLKIYKLKNRENYNTGIFKIDGLYKSLRLADCLKTKKILPEYLRASENQRLELVRGLLDTDGSIYKTGDIEFTNTSLDLFNFTYELLISLGQKPTVSTRIGKYNGVFHKKQYRLRFLPNRFDLFNLTRKLELLKTIHITKSQQLRNHYRMIIKYEEVESVPMKCITVDSPNSMYLIGKQMIPTHNTQVGSQWIIYLAEKYPECRIALIGATAGDVLNTLVNGTSGIINSCPPWNKPKWNPSYQKITFKNGSECEYFSGEKPDRIRGRNFSFCLADELTSWRFPKETWDMLSMALRIGTINRRLVTTTPKNIEKYIELLKKDSTWAYVGSTIENLDNLTDDFRDEIISTYAGTRLGAQELEGEILADDDKALWKRIWIDTGRVKIKHGNDGLPLLNESGMFIPQDEILPDFISIVLAIDPAVSVNKKSAETAISVAAYGVDGKYYILYADSAKDTPDGWARRTYELYDEYMCDSIIVETNQGGNLVIDNLKKSGRAAPIVEVRARRGKLLRAEPIAALYERNQVRHFGKFEKCETQMCNFNQHFNKGLCDIVDSTVYALQALVDKVEGFIDGSLLYATGDPRESLMTFRVI